MFGVEQSRSDDAPVVSIDEKTIDAIFHGLNQCHLPGATVGIAIRGKPVYRKGFGLANIELPVVLSPAMRMRIGSTTKHFACLAYMLLCEDGDAQIDDPIGRYLPELHKVTHEVSVRHLMGHLGGLRDVFDISWQFNGTGHAVSSADLLTLYQDIDDVNTSPGTTWSYNNGSYLMLSTAIERITQKPLEVVLQERIFDPVGMHHTMLRRWDTDFVRNSATLHMTNPAGGFEKSYMGTALSGEGGMVSTIDDMLRWLAHMDAPVVGSVATWEVMRTPQRLVNGTSTGYGLGLMIDRYRGIETLSHAGGVMGGNSEMLKVPSAGLDVVVMVNRADVQAMLLVKHILDACLPGLDPVKEVSTNHFVTGTFRSRRTERTILLFPKEGQQVALIDGLDMPLERDNEGVLRPTGIFRFERKTLTLEGDPEKVTSIRLSDFGNDDELLRALPIDAPAVGAIAGLYRSDATRTEAAIFSAEDGPRMRTTGQFGSAVHLLEYIADGTWRAKSTSGMFLASILVFDRDSAGFRFFSARTRALSFRRVRLICDLS